MSIYTMAVAGMVLQMMIKAVKDMELDYDAKEYLVDKLTATFFSIQSDITVAIEDGVTELLKGEDE